MSDFMEVVVIDHYDSFTENLVDDAALAQSSDGSNYLEGKPEVVRYDETSVEDILNKGYDAIVISPGPGNPENKEEIHPTDEILREVSPDVPTLGVCLGMEALVTAYGGSVKKAPEPIHGKAYEIHHDGEKVYQGLDNPFQGGRYHSLIAEDIPDCLEETAHTEQDREKLVMGVRHEDHPIYGVQFHPESVLTGGASAGNDRYGPEMMANFLDVARDYNQNTNKEKGGGV